MRSLLHNLRYTVRTLARAPGFTLAAVLTLALGIGANTAIFGLVYAVLLKPLPFREPGRLLAIWDSYLQRFPKLGVSPLEFAAMRQQTDLLEQTAWFRSVSKDLDLIAPGSDSLELHATFISPGLLSIFGVSPALGRGFFEHESPQSVLLSDRLWKRRFGGRAAVIGQAIRLDDESFTIVGVMPADFRFPESVDLWLPPGPLLADELTNPVRHAIGVIARLRPDVTETQARLRLQSVFARLAADHPKTSSGFHVRVSGLQQDLTAPTRPALLLLWGAVVLVLLIACGNVANLLLSRGSSRAKEMAIRTALGAGSRRLLRQLLTESLVLVLVGAAFGLGLARWSVAAFSPLHVTMDSAVLVFLLAISLLTSILFGLAPAWQALRIDPISAIKSGSAGNSRSGAGRGALVIAEFALAVMVIIGAGILTKSFSRLMRVDAGFNPHRVLTLRVSAPPSDKPEARFRRIAERLHAIPGVDSLAVANALPLIADRANAIRFSVPGNSLINPDSLPPAQARAVSPEYFRAMQIPILSGRAFTERDLNQPVVLINRSMAERFWPGRDPVGARFVTGPWGPNPNWSTIIGVAGDVKQFGLDSESSMDVYFPSLASSYLIIRALGEPSEIAGVVQREIQATDRGAALSDVRTMDQVLAGSASDRRWTTMLLGAFAALALLLALVGIYGLVSWSVAQRTREIGIRMALGAQTAQVRGMVIRQGAKLCLAGLAAGLVCAFVLRSVLAALAFGVSTADPLIYGGAALLITATALLASYLPARRASRIEPLAALRWE